jgi:hypothetical protein
LYNPTAKRLIYNPGLHFCRVATNFIQRSDSALVTSAPLGLVRQLGQFSPGSGPGTNGSSLLIESGHFFPDHHHQGFFPGRPRGRKVRNGQDFYQAWPNRTVFHSPSRFIYMPNFSSLKPCLPGLEWPKRTRPYRVRLPSDTAALHNSTPCGAVPGRERGMAAV